MDDCGEHTEALHPFNDISNFLNLGVLADCLVAGRSGKSSLPGESLPFQQTNRPGFSVLILLELVVGSY